MCGWCVACRTHDTQLLSGQGYRKAGPFHVVHSPLTPTGLLDNIREMVHYVLPQQGICDFTNLSFALSRPQGKFILVHYTLCSYRIFRGCADALFVCLYSTAQLFKNRTSLDINLSCGWLFLLPRLFRRKRGCGGFIKSGDVHIVNVARLGFIK